MTVACVVVFLLVLFIANKATPISSYRCNSDTAGSNAVDTTDLSEAATSLQYCTIDNCTIMRIDTGEELEIIHTTESLIVAVSTDGHTSEIVLMLDNEISCATSTGEYKPDVIWAIARQLGFSIPHSIMNVYIIAVHLLFAELRTVFGKLLMSHNIILFIVQIFSVAIILTHVAVSLGSQVLCQAILNTFMLLTMAFESFSTCILFHTMLIMYYSYKSKSEMPKNLFLFYNCFVFGLFTLFASIIIGYDMYTGNGQQTILPGGYCATYNQYNYQTQRIKDVFHFCNKVAQLTFFIVFLILYYKQRNIISPSKDSENQKASVRASKQLVRITIAMGATVGIARIAWFAGSVFSPIFLSIAGVALIFQQFVVMITFMCTQKMSRLCRERFCPASLNPVSKNQE